MPFLFKDENNNLRWDYFSMDERDSVHYGYYLIRRGSSLNSIDWYKYNVQSLNTIPSSESKILYRYGPGRNDIYWHDLIDLDIVNIINIESEGSNYVDIRLPVTGNLSGESTSEDGRLWFNHYSSIPINSMLFDSENNILDIKEKLYINKIDNENSYYNDRGYITTPNTEYFDIIIDNNQNPSYRYGSFADNIVEWMAIKYNYMYLLGTMYGDRHCVFFDCNYEYRVNLTLNSLSYTFDPTTFYYSKIQWSNEIIID